MIGVTLLILFDDPATVESWVRETVAVFPDENWKKSLVFDILIDLVSRKKMMKAVISELMMASLFFTG